MMLGASKKVAEAIHAELRKRGDYDLSRELQQLSEEDWDAVARAAVEANERATRPAH